MKKLLSVLLLIFLLPLSACGEVKYEFKDGIMYEDGKLLYESKGKKWAFYNREGEEIITDFENIKNIKKVD